MLEDVLKSSEVKIQSKGVKSIRSRVTNIKEYLREEMDVIQFKEGLKELLSTDALTTAYIPCQEDLDAIQELVRTKYETWSWNFGKNPGSKIHRSWQLPDGVLEIYLELEKGYIKTCQIISDFKTPIKLGEIEKLLTNVRYTSTDIQRALTDLDLEKKLGLISKDELVQWIGR
jgi:lipoate-protein ligase A